MDSIVGLLIICLLIANITAIRLINNKHIIKIATIESMKHYTSFRIIKYILKYF